MGILDWITEMADRVKEYIKRGLEAYRDKLPELKIYADKARNMNFDTIDNRKDQVPEFQIELPKDGSPKTFDEWSAYLNVLGKRESSDKWDAVNQFGYLGRYQMGLAALEDAGMVKSGTYKKAIKDGMKNPNRLLDDPSVWNIKGGKDAFLGNPDVQNQAVKKYTDRNESALKGLGVLGEKTSPKDRLGYLMAAHLVGVGGAKDLKKGVVRSDANNTTALEYFELGRNVLK